MFRRSLPLLAVVSIAVLGLVLGGCNAQAKDENAGPKFTGADTTKTAGGSDMTKLPTDTPVDSTYGTTRQPVGTGLGTGLGTGTDPSKTVVLPPPGGKTYTMAPKDTYFSVAVKFYGSGNKANVQKIIDANPKYPDPTKVPVGAQIVIP